MAAGGLCGQLGFSASAPSPGNPAQPSSLPFLSRIQLTQEASLFPSFEKSPNTVKYPGTKNKAPKEQAIIWFPTALESLLC